jgi:NTP pyrophosphatase (non-canonical NTP hydrolase)
MGGLTQNLHHAATGMATEAGEALSTTKKMWVYGQDLGTANKEGKTNQVNLIEEAGDALFYIQMMCNLLGCTLLDLVAANEAKLRLRYPEGYSDQAASARADKSDTVAPWQLAKAGQEATKSWQEYQAQVAAIEDPDKACREN